MNPKQIGREISKISISKYFRFVGAGIIVVLTLLAMFYLFVTAITLLLMKSVFTADNLCKNEILYRLAAPDEKTEAIVFTRNCGATTDFSTQISILTSGAELPNEYGNLFSVQGITWVEIRWLNNTELIVSYDQRAPVLRSEVQITGISAQYNPVEPTE